jgi:hypothetical protein
MKTNVQLIKHIMEFSKHGPLMQAFIIQALNDYSANVVKHEASLKEAMKDSFIHPDAWVGCAKELNGYLNANR